MVARDAGGGTREIGMLVGALGKQGCWWEQPGVVPRDAAESTGGCWSEYPGVVPRDLGSDTQGVSWRGVKVPRDFGGCTGRCW